MTAAAVRASVLVGPEQIVLDSLPRPRLVGNDLLVRVVKCGVCGSDPGFFRGKWALPYPTILGHEIAGVVADAGPGGLEHHEVELGDSVVLEYPIRCGACWYCLTGDYRLCDQGLGYGGPISAAQEPGLWGGYAEYVYAGPGSLVHAVPDGVAPEVALLACAVVANGIRWVQTVGGAQIGDHVLVLGPGPQGLAAVVAAVEAGAAAVTVVGLSRDERRLELARRLGATRVVLADQEDVAAAVAHEGGGHLADLAIDVAGASGTLATAVDCVRKLGTIVLAGMTGYQSTELVGDRLIDKEITIRGVNTHDMRAVAPALRLLAAGRYPLEDLVTHIYPLEAAEEAIVCAEGGLAAERPVKVVIDPAVGG